MKEVKVFRDCLLDNVANNVLVGNGLLGAELSALTLNFNPHTTG